MKARNCPWRSVYGREGASRARIEPCSGEAGSRAARPGNPKLSDGALAVPSADPLRGLLQVTINAILYQPVQGWSQRFRHPPTRSAGRGRLPGDAPTTYSSDEVFFLPGAIEISQVRRLQELERVPDGRRMLRRFMVRGHWRRPARGWSDQRLRWIKPHWRGPQMATIIERTYKLKP
jgi:hypothetical protein